MQRMNGTNWSQLVGTQGLVEQEGRLDRDHWE